MKHICTKICTIRLQINENKGKEASIFYSIVWCKILHRLKGSDINSILIFLILFVFETKDKKNPLKLIRGIELTEEDSSSVDLKYNTALPNRILLQSKLESKN